MEINAEELTLYCWTLLNKTYPKMPYPDIVIENSSNRAAGTAKYIQNKIVLQEWVVGDRDEVLGTIRHELAHFILWWLEPSIRVRHGREFHKILQKIAPETWRHDLCWHFTEAITQSRQKLYSETTYKCTNCSYRYSWERVPQYVENCQCPMCKSNLVKISKKNS